MTTIAQTIRWMDANHGKCIDRTGFYGAQAPDLVNAYAQDLYDLPHVLGNGKDMVTAFINIDFEAVGNWAERQGLPYAGYVDLAGKPEVLKMMTECVEKVNADLSTEPGMADTQVHRFLVLHKELDPDDDELTCAE